MCGITRFHSHQDCVLALAACLPRGPCCGDCALLLRSSDAAFGSAQGERYILCRHDFVAVRTRSALRWSWQLKHRQRLMFKQVRDDHTRSTRKLERVMVGIRVARLDLPKPRNSFLQGAVP